MLIHVDLETRLIMQAAERILSDYGSLETITSLVRRRPTLKDKAIWPRECLNEDGWYIQLYNMRQNKV